MNSWDNRERVYNAVLIAPHFLLMLCHEVHDDCLSTHFLSRSQQKHLGDAGESRDLRPAFSPRLPRLHLDQRRALATSHAPYAAFEGKQISDDALLTAVAYLISTLPTTANSG